MLAQLSAGAGMHLAEAKLMLWEEADKAFHL